VIALRRTLVAVLALVLAHELLAKGLDRLELIERLLSPGWDALIALPLALVLYAIRLALLFVAPLVIALLAIRALGTVRTGSS
jgi:hypothetical protein